METVERIDVLGCPFDAITFDEAVAAIKDAMLENRRLHVVTGNIDFVMKAKRDPIFAEEIRQADLVTADGVPILWAASLLGAPLRGRVNGTDLVWKCAELSALTGCAVALIGAGPGVAMRAAKKMQDRFPGAGIHAIPTPFQLGSLENTALVEQIKAIKAKIILAALGAPKQERWLQAHLDECGANVGVGVGSAFDIICGDIPRAPRWMRENGLEWFHRMLFEPKRLGRRYLIEDSPFILHFIAAFARRRFLGDVNKS
jgi:N-acetylglucosaminyldiphosphoundecaprenol N-acetyl-beta-D-mannosaminyltransferase